MFTDLLNSSYFALFLIVALGFMLGRIKIKGLSLDVSAVIFIALLFGHFGVIIPKELGNFGLVLFIFTIGIQAARLIVAHGIHDEVVYHAFQQRTVGLYRQGSR